MQYLCQGALYFKITFLKSLTTLMVNHLNFVKQEGVGYQVGLFFFSCNLRINASSF